ncbi:MULTISPECIES: hypothetical protein [Acinetobacter]|uniref:hypothetical protein n=1 Tax=Acinetobacter TaxID=469 RepID=UPI00148F527F|nr:MULTISPECIES: hypothetical protein [Acinetobacter]MCH7294115.1 hypothetical protein [Acinetobacter higginsii]NNP71274.1 hypothetical protein [Acinetobacter sp. Ac_5812]
MSYLRVGDLVKPDRDAEIQAGWKPKGELRLVAIKRGIRSGKSILKAKDERGVFYYGLDGCFEKVGKG